MRHLASLWQPQFLIYIAGGVLSAVVDIGLLQLLSGRGVDPMSAASAGFLGGLLVNYAFHAKVTFRNLAGGGSLLRYLSLVALNYLLTLGMVALSVRLTGSPLPGKVLSLPLVAVNGYLLGKHWVFRPA